MFRFLAGPTAVHFDRLERHFVCYQQFSHERKHFNWRIASLFAGD